MAEQTVVNASPLIFLGTARLLELLLLAGDQVHVPKAVFREVTADQRGFELRQTLESLGWLKIVDPPPIPQTVLAWDLGAGESSVLSWALSHPGAVAVIDDLAGRKCARAHGLPLKGTLGIVLNARKQGKIKSARVVLRKLIAAGMHLSESLLIKALAEIGE